MLRLLFILTAISSSCGNPPAGSESQFLSTNDGSEQGALGVQDNSKELKLVPYGYEGFESQYIYPSSIDLGGTNYLVDILRLKSKLLALGYQARKGSDALCFEGCALYTNLYLLPVVKTLYSRQELKSFQRIKPCYKESDGNVLCVGGPTSYTKKGSADFCVDLVQRLFAKGIDVISQDGQSIDADKVLSFLKG